jgi:hypothetical protein
MEIKLKINKLVESFRRCDQWKVSKRLYSKNLQNV